MKKRIALNWKNLWKCVELKKSNTQKIFIKIICGKQKSVYYLNVTYLEISHYYWLSDKKFKSIVNLFPNIIYLDLYSNGGFSDKTLNWIAKSYSSLKYLNLQKWYNNELLTDKGLYAIANSCQKLEYLNISHRKEFSEIAIWNVIHSCLRIQQLDIFECNITYSTIEEIGLYFKLKYFNLSTATWYLEKISWGQIVLGKDQLNVVFLSTDRVISFFLFEDTTYKTEYLWQN